MEAWDFAFRLEAWADSNIAEAGHRYRNELLNDVIDFGRISLGTQVREVLPLIERAIGDENERIDNAAIAAHLAGTLTGEQALAAFAAKGALSSILRKLRQYDNTGRAAARRVAQHEDNYGSAG